MCIVSALIAMSGCSLRGSIEERNRIWVIDGVEEVTIETSAGPMCFIAYNLHYKNGLMSKLYDGECKGDTSD